MSAARPLFSFWGISTFVIVLASFYLYGGCIDGSLVWDDIAIVHGSTIGGGTLWAALTKPFNFTYYRPFTSLSYAIDFNLFGQDPAFFHLTNIAIHALGALLVLWVGNILLRNRYAALAAGLCFAIQPAQVGATAWIGGRTDALSSVCILAFVGGLIQWQDTRKRGWLALSVVSFFVSAMVKEQSLAFLLLVPFSEFLLGDRNRLRAVKTTAPFAIASALFLAIWLMNYPHPMVPGKVTPLLLGERFLQSIVHYTGQFLAPTGVGLHSFSLFNYSNPLWLVLGLALLVGYGWGLVVLWKRDRRLAFAAVGAVIAFLPISNIVPLPSLLVGPYRVAQAGCFVALLMGQLMGWALTLRKLPVIALSVLYLGWCLFRLPIAVEQYNKESTFFGAAYEYDPYSIVTTNNSIRVDLAEGHPEEAIRKVHQILGTILGPSWNGELASIPQTVANGDAQRRIERNDGGDRQATHVVSFDLCKLYSAYAALGQTDKADEVLDVAQHVWGTDPAVLASLGDRAMKIDSKLALNYYRQCLEQTPEDFDSLRRLAGAEQKLGMIAEATEHYRLAAEARPWLSPAWLKYSKMLEDQGQLPRAVYALRRAEDGLFGDKASIVKHRLALVARYRALNK